MKPRGPLPPMTSSVIVGSKKKIRFTLGPAPERESGPPYYTETISCPTDFEKSQIDITYIRMKNSVVAEVDNQSKWSAIISFFKDGVLIRSSTSESSAD